MIKISSVFSLETENYEIVRGETGWRVTSKETPPYGGKALSWSYSHTSPDPMREILEGLYQNRSILKGLLT